MLLCARSSANPERIERIRELAQGRLDWEWLLSKARGHRVASLLYWNLHSVCPHALPAGVLRRLRREFHQGLQRSLLLAEELVALAQLFAREAIPMLSFKGPTLSACAYRQLGLRQFDDLDLLVPARHVEQACNLLVASGYRPQWPVGSTMEAANRRFGGSAFFAGGDRKTAVDLHWKLGPRYFPWPLSLEGIWARSTLLSIGSQQLRSPGREDLVLILCLHGSHHCWARLIWISDVAEAVEAADLDWPRLLQRATVLGIRRRLLLGLRLAQICGGVSLSAPIQRELQADRLVCALAEGVRAALFRHPGVMGAWRWRTTFQPFHLAIIEHPLDRVAYLVRMAMVPSPEDATSVVLPAPLFELYHPLRPLRLVGKGIHALVSKQLSPVGRRV